MKRKIFTLVAIVCISSSLVSAQITKGSIFLGGSLGINKSKEDPAYTNQTNIHISPAIGLAINENTIVGVKLGYGLQKHRFGTDYTNYAAGVFLRKYKSLGKGFYLFGEGNLGLSYTKQKEYITVNPSFETYMNKNYSLGIGFNPGISYQVSKKIHLELSLPDLISANYNWGERVGVHSASMFNRKTHGYSLNSNLSLNGINSLAFGIRFLLK